MDLQSILKTLENCPCGREHTFDTRVCEIGRGLVRTTGEILRGAGFATKLLLVSDRNAMNASPGLMDSLDAAGFEVKQLIYQDMRYARAEQVAEIEALCGEMEGILSAGTGSVNDICRMAAYNQDLPLAIFATAPSMDGFASNNAAIVTGSFKLTSFVRQPVVVIGDTDILAAAPAELKAAGFGDMMAKFLALVEWKIGRLLIDEYYCDRVADMVRYAIDKLVALADRITANDPEVAGEVMEALVFTGLAMRLTGNSRPASGAEHVLSHYWECKKLVAGVWSDFHGKKVGVATLLCSRLYRQIAQENLQIETMPDSTDWEEVKAVYGPELCEDMMKENTPETITAKIDPARLKEAWPQIRRMILEELPTDQEFLSLMERAGAATRPSQVNISEELLREGLKYHPYMRYRVLLPRLLPMMNIRVPEVVYE